MNAGTIHPLRSGGVLVDVGDAFPIWRADAGAARRLLLERDLNPPTSAGSGLAHRGEKAAGPAPVGPAASNAEVAA